MANPSDLIWSNSQQDASEQKGKELKAVKY